MTTNDTERLERDLERVFAVPVPDLQFEMPYPHSAPRRISGRMRVAAVGGVAAVVVLGAVLLPLGFTGGGTKTVSAEELIERAQQVAVRGAAETSATTFHKVTRAEADHGGRGSSIREWRQWGDGPDRWRVEIHVGDGTGRLRLESVTTSDGTTMYAYDSRSGQLTTEPYDAATWRVYGSDGGLGAVRDGANMEAVLDARRGCFSPTVAGKETVAGRETYVVDLGDNHCSKEPVLGGAPDGQRVYLMRPTRLWIDSETFSVVREDNVGGPGDALQSTTTVVSYERGAVLAPDMFVIDPAAPAR